MSSANALSNSPLGDDRMRRILAIEEGFREEAEAHESAAIDRAKKRALFGVFVDSTLIALMVAFTVHLVTERLYGWGAGVAAASALYGLNTVLVIHAVRSHRRRSAEVEAKLSNAGLGEYGINGRR